MSVDSEMRAAQRGLAAQGLVVHLVIKDHGYEGHDVWCLVAGPLVEDDQWREWRAEREHEIARCHGLWRENEGPGLNKIQVDWLATHGPSDRNWVERFWQSTVGKTYEAARAAFLAPLFAKVGESFDDFLVLHKGMTRVDYKRTMIE